MTQVARCILCSREQLTRTPSQPQGLTLAELLEIGWEFGKIEGAYRVVCPLCSRSKEAS